MSSDDARADVRVKTLLVVEDTADIRDTLQMLLEIEGYEVLLATHGKEALAMLREGARPGLILLDLYMPVMDGQQFVMHRAEEQLATEIPVVVFAATRQQIQLPGVVDWITKPIGVDTLLETIERWYGKSLT
jgi:CheY-like chemotaxis protein